MTDGKIEIIYKESDIERFRRDILAGNLCDIFLPVTFIEADGMIGAVYDTEGYVRYTDLKDVSASTLIGAVTSILEKSRQAERRYFFTGEYSIDPSLLFVNLKIPDAALIYGKCVPMCKMVFLDCLKRILKPEENVVVRGEDFIRKALFILGDSSKSYEVILHDLMAVGTEAFQAEC